jgi:hypothetical protein
MRHKHVNFRNNRRNIIRMASRASMEANLYRTMQSSSVDIVHFRRGNRD